MFFSVRSQALIFVALIISTFLFAGSAYCEETEQRRQELVRRGLKYLADHGQSETGMFSDRVGPGVTALVITASIRNGRAPTDPVVAKSLRALEKFVRPDGGIYGSGRLKNYETCVSIVALAQANTDGRYNEILGKAKDFVTEMQYGVGDRASSDRWYGGASYDGSGRPDLSNTAYLIEALRALETPSDDPAIQAALAFVSRSQNLASKHNDTEFADKVNDGGFYYLIPSTKVDPSTTDERITANGGLRSYGSMTYTGLKSMIYAGLTPEDRRVKAAVQWVTENYDVTSNPGLGSAGLYYYYHTFAAGLSVAGVDQLSDSGGQKHDWRRDLVEELADRCNEDGSWQNRNERWFENDKNLATAFALMALAYARPIDK